MTDEMETTDEADATDLVDPVDQNDTEDKDGAEAKAGTSDGAPAAIVRLKEERTELRERLTEKDEELSSAVRERDELREQVQNTGVLEAVAAAGILPEFLTTEERRIVTDAGVLSRDLEFWDSHIGDDSFEVSTGGETKTFTSRDAAKFAAQVRAKLRGVEGRAGVIRERAQGQIKELLALGKAAKKSGWKPGAKTANTTAKTNGIPQGGRTARTPNAATPGGVPKVDWKKTMTQDEWAEKQAEQLMSSR
jgi:hypothetical protein